MPAEVQEGTRASGSASDVKRCVSCGEVLLSGWPKPLRRERRASDIAELCEVHLQARGAKQTVLDPAVRSALVSRARGHSRRSSGSCGVAVPVEVAAAPSSEIRQHPRSVDSCCGKLGHCLAPEEGSSYPTIAALGCACFEAPSLVSSHLFLSDVSMMSSFVKQGFLRL